MFRTDVCRPAADVLSRLQTTEEDDTLLKENFAPVPVGVEGEQKRIFAIYDQNSKIVWLNERERQLLVTPSTLEEVIVKQALDMYCKEASLKVS